LEKALGQIKGKAKKPEHYRQAQNQQQIGS
jgi:hypothetical protein